MEFREIESTGIVEIIADGIIINNADDGLELLGNAYYQGYNKIIVHEENITPAFFDLKNKLAGEILQKFSNYRVRLVVLGNFTNIKSKSLNDFIRESNNGKLVNFLNSKEEAVDKLSA